MMSVGSYVLANGLRYIKFGINSGLTSFSNERVCSSTQAFTTYVFVTNLAVNYIACESHNFLHKLTSVSTSNSRVSYRIASVIWSSLTGN